MRLFNRRALIVVDTSQNLGRLANQAFVSSATGQATTTPKVFVPALSIPCGKDGFDCKFDVQKDLTGKPNRGAVHIYNLNQEHRDGLSERADKGPVRVRLDAGYGDEMHRIFEGDLRILYHEKTTAADTVTRIESGDGDFILSNARLVKSWAPGTPVEQVLRDLTTALGIGAGNSLTSIGGALLQGYGPIFTGGTAVSGRIFPELTNITRSAGLEWSIQDGTLQILRSGKGLDTTAVKVTGDTGMEGPSAVDHKGRLHVVTRLIPDIFPGRKIQLVDRTVWVVKKAHYYGETRGSTWNVKIEALPVAQAPVRVQVGQAVIEQ